jgi:glycosyltransferase involved in cell wall biosynthesis
MVIVGGGPEENAIKKAFCGIAPERIHWCGQVHSDDVAGWLSASDVFIWPGWKEPIGMVYLEAAYRGLPIVAFDNMGVPLVVRHGETGLLCRLDDLAGFRHNLKTLLADKTLRRKMGQAAKSYVEEKHSQHAATDRLKTLLTNIYKESIS